MSLVANNEKEIVYKYVSHACIPNGATLNAEFYTFPVLGVCIIYITVVVFWPLVFAYWLAAILIGIGLVFLWIPHKKWTDIHKLKEDCEIIIDKQSLELKLIRSISPARIIDLSTVKKIELTNYEPCYELYFWGELNYAVNMPNAELAHEIRNQIRSLLQERKGVFLENAE
jgi:hypothetical protein